MRTVKLHGMKHLFGKKTAELDDIVEHPKKVCDLSKVKHKLVVPNPKKIWK